MHLRKKFQVDYRAAEDIDNDVQEGLKSDNLGAYVTNRIQLFMGTGVHFTIL
jgi:hypothetical protein